LETENRTESVVRNAMGRLTAMRRHRGELERLSGMASFEQQASTSPPSLNWPNATLCQGSCTWPRCASRVWKAPASCQTIAVSQRSLHAWGAILGAPRAGRRRECSGTGSPHSLSLSTALPKERTNGIPVSAVPHQARTPRDARRLEALVKDMKGLDDLHREYLKRRWVGMVMWWHTRSVKLAGNTSRFARLSSRAGRHPRLDHPEHAHGLAGHCTIAIAVVGAVVAGARPGKAWPTTARSGAKSGALRSC